MAGNRGRRRGGEWWMGWGEGKGKCWEGGRKWKRGEGVRGMGRVCTEMEGRGRRGRGVEVGEVMDDGCGVGMGSRGMGVGVSFFCTAITARQR